MGKGVEIRRTPIRSIWIEQRQSPGDIIMLTAAVRDLKLAYPAMRVNVSSTAQEIWDNSPRLDPSLSKAEADATIYAEYPDINRCNDGCFHFGHAFAHYLAEALGLNIPVRNVRGEVWINADEAERFGGWLRDAGLPESGYWLVDAGIKSDYTAKGWEVERWQSVVDMTMDSVTWVQIGAAEHNHPALRGVVDLRGRTSIRELILLMHRAGGVITPVSFPMHLAAATPMWGQPPNRRRPCVVLGGGREPASWVGYNEQQYVHTGGALPCCDNGGCWRSRVEPLADGDEKNKSLCVYRVKSAISGRTIQKCMDMIYPEQVALLVRQYLQYGAARPVAG